MKPDTLQHFSRQLHSWCAERLEQKPGPFRQAELHPHLIGQDNSLSPPVVLWVNRDSCLAGGIILIPGKEEQESFDSGLDTARALGLPYFHTWGRYEVTCWSASHDPPEKIWEYGLPPEDNSSPGIFRKGLNRLIDHMEQSFFENQLQIPTVSDLYLTNLMHTTFIDLLPDVQKNLLSDQTSDTEKNYSLIEISNMVFRVLVAIPGLALCNVLPAGTAPVTIYKSLAMAMAELPAHLQRVWSDQPAGLHFPEICQRRLHHYFCRIQQLGTHSGETVIASVKRLLQEWATNLGGHPIPEQPSELRRVAINADSLNEMDPPTIEIGPPGILAATALIRHFSAFECSGPGRQETSIFTLSEDLPEHLISGTLLDDNRTSVAKQKELNAILRVSWPNRKLSFPAKTPLWVWHFLHLCGLAKEQSQLDLIIPANWLREHYGAVITSALSAKLIFIEIKIIDRGRLHCQLRIAEEEQSATAIILANGERRTLKNGHSNSLRSRILLALNVPPEINQLIDIETLKFHQLEEMERFPMTGLENFINSTLGQWLWKLIAPGRTVPKGDKLIVELFKTGLPLPGKAALAALARLGKTNNHISTADIDQELAVWIGHKIPQLPNIKPGREPKKQSKHAVEATDHIELFKEKCLAEELPIFPDNYLYDIPFGERTHYTLTGPLEIVDTFFEQVILADQQQQKITVNGIKQAEALILISSFRSGSVELPQSNLATADIIDRYYGDLVRLRQKFSLHAAEINSDEKRRTIVDLIWRELPLPKWPLITRQ